MKITIIVDDKNVIMDGVLVHLPNMDWGNKCFTGDPGTVLDDVAAVQFDDDAGQGHVEYKTLLTKQTFRPNVRPPDCPITAADFQENFGWVLNEWAAGYERKKAAEEAAEEERRRSIEAAEAASRADVAETKLGVAQEAGGATLAEMEALKAEIAEMRKIAAKHTAYISGQIEDAQKIVGEGNQ